MDEQYMGVIAALGFNFAPRNFGYCGGALIAISQNTALFSLIGTKFGGDGRTSFGLPDLRGRTPMGQFQAPGLSNRLLGQFVGQENVALTQNNLPSHTHLHTYAGSGGTTGTVVEVAKTHGTVQDPGNGDYIAMPSDGFGSAPEGNLYVTESEAAAAGTALIGGVSGGGAFDSSALTILETGAGQDFTIMQPSLVINFCICLTGLFPSRS